MTHSPDPLLEMLGYLKMFVYELLEVELMYKLLLLKIFTFYVLLKWLRFGDGLYLGS